MGAHNVISSETLQIHLLMDLNLKYGILKNFIANECSHVHVETVSVQLVEIMLPN